MRCVPTVPVPHPHPQSVWACPSGVLDTLQVGTEFLANGRAGSFATGFLSPVGKPGGRPEKSIFSQMLTGGWEVVLLASTQRKPCCPQTVGLSSWA